MNDYFEPLWALLYDHGACERKKEGTQRFWNTLTPAQQRGVFTTISEKLKNGRFVQYDPVRAIKENLQRLTDAEPTNYNGQRTMPKDTPLVTAKYNGLYGIYTAAEAQLFGMTDIKNYHP